MSCYILTDFPPLSLNYLIMYFSFDLCPFFHQDIVFDRQDKVLQLLGYLRSPPPAFLLALVCAFCERVPSITCDCLAS